MRMAIFPGSFDPFTNGHLDIARRASRLFDQLVIAVLINPNKRECLAPAARADMIRRVTTDLPNVRVEQFSGLLVRYAASCGAQAIVRGLRAANDFEYEFQMAQLNRGMDSAVETLFIMTAPQYAYVSSSSVREIAALGGDITPLVPEALRAEIYAACQPPVSAQGDKGGR